MVFNGEARIDVRSRMTLRSVTQAEPNENPGQIAYSYIASEPSGQPVSSREGETVFPDALFPHQIYASALKKPAPFCQRGAVEGAQKQFIPRHSPIQHQTPAQSVQNMGGKIGAQSRIFPCACSEATWGRKKSQQNSTPRLKGV